MSPGLVLVTDAITAMGLPPGRHSLGQQVIEIQGLHAYVAGPENAGKRRSSPVVHWCISKDVLESVFKPFRRFYRCFHLSGTDTLSGSIATMDMCVRHFRQASGQSLSLSRLRPVEPRQLRTARFKRPLAGCSVEEALEAASLHPAQLLGISPRKGKLDYGSDAGQDPSPPTVHSSASPGAFRVSWKRRSRFQIMSCGANVSEGASLRSRF